MPLMKYFGFVGSALALLLIGLGWCFPQPASESIGTDKERLTIRISSAEQVPERVVIDTSIRTIVPPPIINSAAPTIVTETVQPRLSNAFAELATEPKAPGEVPQTKHVTKRDSAKKIVFHRAAQPLIIAPAPAQLVQRAAPDTRMSLLETLKERLGQLPQLLEAQTY